MRLRLSHFEVSTTFRSKGSVASLGQYGCGPPGFSPPVKKVFTRKSFIHTFGKVCAKFREFSFGQTSSHNIIISHHGIADIMCIMYVILVYRAVRPLLYLALPMNIILLKSKWSNHYGSNHYVVT